MNRSKVGSRMSERGFIVVATLWLLAALAGLILVGSLYMTQSAIALSAFDAATQLQMISTGGVELAAYQLSGVAPEARPSRGSFTFRLANARVAVEYQSEAARINLNMAPRSFIAGLFAALGVGSDAAGQLADRVAAWRNPPRQNFQDEEDSRYAAAGLKYRPRHAAFSNIDELSLVMGMPPELVERARPYLTLYSGIAGINVLEAAPEVLAALPDMTSAKADAFLNQRDSLSSKDPDFVLGILGGRVAGATVAVGNAYRIRMRIILPDGRDSRSEGVIMLPDRGTKSAYRVFTWRDEIDPSTGGAQR
ncbi:MULTISPECIES: general secretion pathway protein GspK [Bradyrhizobium]|uniref:general secretion pathway protein GspK n=1 Tax=Bradyrhizobium TaxID=374 RepID=UPI00047F9B6B|nr:MULTISPECIES: type II secretion system protein GspK [Bradyrhizobium]QOG20647.1 general secretion pathway protein GspK [Bradyrhizobium sp. SEMIA]UFW46065.1 general secretion pathway protein GspK [Bradyrhizobium arachidis]